MSNETDFAGVRPGDSDSAEEIEGTTLAMYAFESSDTAIEPMKIGSVMKRCL